jgi:hypothetical protein
MFSADELQARDPADLKYRERARSGTAAVQGSFLLFGFLSLIG